MTPPPADESPSPPPRALAAARRELSARALPGLPGGAAAAKGGDNAEPDLQLLEDLYRRYDIRKDRSAPAAEPQPAAPAPRLRDGPPSPGPRRRSSARSASSWENVPSDQSEASALSLGRSASGLRDREAEASRRDGEGARYEGVGYEGVGYEAQLPQRGEPAFNERASASVKQVILRRPSLQARPSGREAARAEIEAEEERALRAQFAALGRRAKGEEGGESPGVGRDAWRNAGSAADRGAAGAGEGPQDGSPLGPHFGSPLGLSAPAAAAEPLSPAAKPLSVIAGPPAYQLSSPSQAQGPEERPRPKEVDVARGPPPAFWGRDGPFRAREVPDWSHESFARGAVPSHPPAAQRRLDYRETYASLDDEGYASPTSAAAVRESGSPQAGLSRCASPAKLAAEGGRSRRGLRAALRRGGCGSRDDSSISETPLLTRKLEHDRLQQEREALRSEQEAHAAQLYGRASDVLHAFRFYRGEEPQGEEDEQRAEYVGGLVEAHAEARRLKDLLNSRHEQCRQLEDVHHRVTERAEDFEGSALRRERELAEALRILQDALGAFPGEGSLPVQGATAKAILSSLKARLAAMREAALVADAKVERSEADSTKVRLRLKSLSQDMERRRPMLEKARAAAEEEEARVAGLEEDLRLQRAWLAAKGVAQPALTQVEAPAVKAIYGDFNDAILPAHGTSQWHFRVKPLREWLESTGSTARWMVQEGHRLPQPPHQWAEGLGELDTLARELEGLPTEAVVRLAQLRARDAAGGPASEEEGPQKRIQKRSQSYPEPGPSPQEAPPSRSRSYPEPVEEGGWREPDRPARPRPAPLSTSPDGSPSQQAALRPAAHLAQQTPMPVMAAAAQTPPQPADSKSTLEAKLQQLDEDCNHLRRLKDRWKMMLGRQQEEAVERKLSPTAAAQRK